MFETMTKLEYTAPRLALIVAEPGAVPKEKPVMRTPGDAARLLEPLRYASEEKFVLILLDARHEVTGLIEISHGTLSSSLVHPREVFKAALLANAYAIMVAHNHPSGSRAASPEDIETTKKLAECAELLGVTMLDHIIVTAYGEYTSIREEHPECWPATK